MPRLFPPNNVQVHSQRLRNEICRLANPVQMAEVSSHLRNFAVAEVIGRKIRDAELRKIPYMLVVGDREAENGEVSVRRHKGGDTGSESVAAFAERVVRDAKTRSS